MASASAKVTKIARQVRKRLIEREGCSTAQCYEASLELYRELRNAGFGASIVGGTFEIDEPDPEVTPKEAWETGDAYFPWHWWVEVDGRVVDITADQFDHEVDGGVGPITIGTYRALRRYRALKRTPLWYTE